MKKFFEKIYFKYGIKRRYRQVRDGLWIFGSNGPAGIFISKQDWLDNPKFYQNYLFDVDDELAAKAGLN